MTTTLTRPLSNKLILAGIAALLSLAFSALLLPAPALAQGVEEHICAGIQGSVDNFACPASESDRAINNLIRQVINVFSLVVGVVAVIMIMVGGFKYVTSGGDASSVSSAKNTILYAIIGLVIVALAQFIIRFVFSRLQAI